MEPDIEVPQPLVRKHPWMTVTTIATWEGADRALGVLRLIAARLDGVNATFDARIQALQEQKAARAADLLEHRKRIEELLEGFAPGARRSMPATRKSMKLVHGVIGWRKSAAKLKYTTSAKYTMQALKARGHTDCVKVKESIDKAALKKLSDTERAHVGVALVSSEVFFYELNGDPIVDYVPMADEDVDVEARR